MRIGSEAALVMQRQWQRAARSTHVRWRTAPPNRPRAYRLAVDVTCCPAATIVPTSTKGTIMANQQTTPTRKQPAATGTIVGAPPTLEWIGVDQLHIDESYQRAIDGPASQRIIRGMIGCWDWRLCQPLAVVRRDDGGLFVIDGQHRLAGARRRGNILHLPCVVTRPDNEAEMFVALNTKRARLSQTDVFNASLASGDADAQAVKDICDRLGIGFARSSNYLGWQPRQIFCGPMLQRALKLHGPVVVEQALAALAEGHRDQVLSVAATLLKALFVIFAEDAHRPGFDRSAFIEGLASCPHGDWPAHGADTQRAQPGLSRVNALAACMMEAHDAILADRADR